MTPPNGAVPVAAAINIGLSADGKLHCNAQVPSRDVLRMMMQKALGDLEMQMYAQEEAARVQVAAPGFDLAQLGWR